MNRKGWVKFQNIPLSHGKMLPHNYFLLSDKGDIHSSKSGTGTRTSMGKPVKIHSSETIFGWNVETTTWGSHRTDQLYRTDAK